MREQTPLSAVFPAHFIHAAVVALVALSTLGFVVPGCAPEAPPVSDAAALADQRERLGASMQQLHERLGALDLRIEALGDDDPRESTLDGLRASLEARVDSLNRRAVRAARGGSPGTLEALIEDAEALTTRVDAALADPRFDLVPFAEDEP